MSEVNGLTKDPRMNDVRSLLASMKSQFEMALPRHLSADRMIRVALTACQRNPKLLDCTPRSFAAAMMTAAQVGLEPDGTLGRAYMIPRRNNKAGTTEANFQFGYQGLLELCHRSGEIASVRADVVRKGDAFVFSKGLDEKMEHREGADNFDAEIVYVYAIIRTKSGGMYWDAWPAKKVEAHRLRFSKDGRDDSVWITDWPSMAKKTLLLAVLKYAPKSVEVAAAVAADEQGELALPTTVDVVDVEPPGPPKTIEDLKTRARRPKATAPPPVDDNPFVDAPAKAPAAELQKQQSIAGAAEADRGGVDREVRELRAQIDEGLFRDILKRHGGDVDAGFFGLGTFGLKGLRDEMRNAIG